MEAIKSNAKRSSNARTRGPKAADHKGHQGHALAAIVIAQAEKIGELMVAQQLSRKDMLKRLSEFRDNAEHIEFRKELDAKLLTIKEESDKAKLSLNAYCDANPRAAAMRVECSLWNKMSAAVEKGFPVADFLDKPWAEISKGATAHLDNMRNSTGNAAQNGNANAKLTNAGPKQRVGRKAKNSIAKAQEFVAQVLKDPITKAPLPKDNRNLAQVVATLIADATMEELTEVAAVVERQIKYATEAAAKAQAATQKASDEAKALHAAATGTKTSGKRKGVAGTPPANDADKEIERAQASTGRVRATPAGRPLAKAR